jgi:hypothetical protein
MKFNLYEQFSPQERALMLLEKYRLPYLREIINSIIVKTRKANEIEHLNYWNEVAVEIKNLIRRKNETGV